MLSITDIQIQESSNINTVTKKILFSYIIIGKKNRYQFTITLMENLYFDITHYQHFSKEMRIYDDRNNKTDIQKRKSIYTQMNILNH